MHTHRLLDVLEVPRIVPLRLLRPQLALVRPVVLVPGPVRALAPPDRLRHPLHPVEDRAFTLAQHPYQVLEARFCGTGQPLRDGDPIRAPAGFPRGPRHGEELLRPHAPLHHRRDHTASVRRELRRREVGRDAHGRHVQASNECLCVLCQAAGDPHEVEALGPRELRSLRFHCQSSAPPGAAATCSHLRERSAEVDRADGE